MTQPKLGVARCLDNRYGDGTHFCGLVQGHRGQHKEVQRW